MKRYLACLLLVAGLVMWSRPDEAELPVRSAPVSIGVREIQALAVERYDGLPAWSAERAIPARPGSALQLGGAIDGVELFEVAVELTGDRRMTADRGRFRDGALVLLGAVRVEAAGGVRLLESGEARVTRTGVHFPGIVGVRRAGAEQRFERDVTWTFAELDRLMK